MTASTRYHLVVTGEQLTTINATDSIAVFPVIPNAPGSEITTGNYLVSGDAGGTWIPAGTAGQDLSTNLQNSLLPG